jgi:Tfp pilus assembly protein PilF
MRKQLLVATTALALVAVAAIAAWAALRSREQPQWTTSSPEALAELRRGLASEQKLYDADARKHFARALEIDPQFAAARLMLYRHSARKDPKGKALLAGLEAVDRSRLTGREAFLVDYTVDMGQGRYADARSRLATYLKEHPRDPYALDLQINAYWEDQRWPQAEQTCKELLAVDPNWVTAQNKLGYLAMSQGHFAEAEDRFRTYLYVAPDQANPHDSLGELLLLRGQYDEATGELEAAIAARPDFCASYFHLAQLALMQRDVAASRAAIDRARRQPACRNRDLAVRDCSQHMWELFSRQDWQGLSRSFDDRCMQETHANVWMPHLAATLVGDLDRARAIEGEVAKWNQPDPGPVGRSILKHLEGIRLVAEGNPTAGAEALAAADAEVGYFSADLGVFKLYNRLQWANALDDAGSVDRARQVIADVAAVNGPMAALYREGKLVLPSPTRAVRSSM